MTALVVVLALVGVVGLYRTFAGPAGVGHFRSAQDRQEYLGYYQQVMETMPAPSQVEDVITSYGTVRVYTGESVSTVRSYADRVGNDFTQVADESQAISASYGVMGVPSHVFIDADGVVHQVQVGLLSSDQMARAIEEVKAG